MINQTWVFNALSTGTYFVLVFSSSQLERGNYSQNYFAFRARSVCGLCSCLYIFVGFDTTVCVESGNTELYDNGLLNPSRHAADCNTETPGGKNPHCPNQRAKQIMCKGHRMLFNIFLTGFHWVWLGVESKHFATQCPPFCLYSDFMIFRWNNKLQFLFIAFCFLLCKLSEKSCL